MMDNFSFFFRAHLYILYATRHHTKDVVAFNCFRFTFIKSGETECFIVGEERENKQKTDTYKNYLNQVMKTTKKTDPKAQ